MSSAKSEYVAAACALQAITGLLEFFKELNLELQLPIVLYEGNQSTKKLAESGKYNNKTKHISLRYNLLKHLVGEGTIMLCYL